jgi:hypothetical protein
MRPAYAVEKITYVFGLLTEGLMKCRIFARLTFSNAVSSGSIAGAFRFNEAGAVGTDTLRVMFAARTRCGSGSRHRGGAVASYKTTLGILYVLMPDLRVCGPRYPKIPGPTIYFPSSGLVGKCQPITFQSSVGEQLGLR